MASRRSRRSSRPRSLLERGLGGTFTIITSTNGRKRFKKADLYDLPAAPPQQPADGTFVKEETQIQKLENVEELSILAGKPRQTKTQNDILNDWTAKFDVYMDALLEFEDFGRSDHCARCDVSGKALYRCATCLGQANHCANCLLMLHQGMPLHRVTFWDAEHGCFQNISLGSIGLVLYLGHPRRLEAAPCSLNQSLRNLTVVHTNGIHRLQVSFCSCATAKTPDIQLFSQRLFPASQTSPQTVFSFELLEQLRYHHLEGKGSAYKFMQALYRLTDDIRPSELQDRVRELRRVFREWDYMQICKRSGHYWRSSASSQPQLAVECPACPHPGQNLSWNWQEEVSSADHWLHRQFIHFDANFRLTLEKKDSRAAGDTSLWGNEGYFVDSKAYKRYLAASAPDLQEASDCVDHRAAAQISRTRFDTLEVTGVAGAVCRHGCAIPKSFVDLQKGERYVNIDYGLSSAFARIINIKEIVLSYDIACQFFRKFRQRFAASPFLNLPASDLIFLIPKFHLPVHKEECRYYFSFNYIKGVGRTDGEGIERFWSPHNYLSGSTMKMTPGSRVDTLNDNFADWNWRKTCKMGESLQKRLLEAEEQVRLHTERFQELCDSLADEAMAQKWILLEDAYTPTFGERTIYQLATEEAPTKAAILQQLTDPRGNPLQPQGAAPAGGWTVAALWIDSGLRLEESLRLLAAHAALVTQGHMEIAHHRLDQQRSDLQDRITEWTRLSPLNVQETSADDNAEDGEVEELEMEALLRTTLALPSSFIGTKIDSQLLPGLNALEMELRKGQAYDALKQLRKTLGLRLALYRESNKHPGQKSHHRSQAAFQRLDREVDLIASRYRSAYSALTALGLNPNTTDLQLLNTHDISTAFVFDLNRGTGRGRVTGDISWIWRMRGAGRDLEDETWLEEVLRVQFLDAKTTMDRWNEETKLVKAELLRTSAYFSFMSEQWKNRALCANLAGARAHASSMKLTFRRLSEGICRDPL